MHAGDSGLICSRGRSGELVVRTGVPLADVYLEFLGGRCRPNTVRAAAYDLKVLFSVADKPPAQVQAADVPNFDRTVKGRLWKLYPAITADLLRIPLPRVNAVGSWQEIGCEQL